MQHLPMWPAVIIALAYGLWLLRRGITRRLDTHVSDSERRRKQQLILSGLRTMRRERRRRIRGEETEQL